jgi:hypothetical protein
MNRFLILFLVAITLIACNKDDDFVPKAEVNKSSLQFSYEGGADSVTITSNTDWSFEEDADWITLSKTSGASDDIVRITVAENTVTATRSANITIKVIGHADITISVSQSKALETVGLYMLSEGNLSSIQSDIAWYDTKTEQFTKKYFSQTNGHGLGLGANDLAIYGSKMYCVVTGGIIGTPNTEGHIEVINPETGMSIKRISVAESDGTNSFPRNITFHEGKAYVTTYSKSVVRLDTASLEIDGRATISGTFAEGVCRKGDNLYICNSGQGSGNTVSVVNIGSFTETGTITVPTNPTTIKTVPSGEVYFTTADASWSGGNPSNIHILDTEQKKVDHTFNIRASKFAFYKNFVYAVDFDWSAYSEHISKINTKTKEVEDLSSMVDDYFMVYSVSVNPLNGDIYLGNQGQDVAGFDKNGHEIFKKKTGLACTSIVVPVLK